ncbi:MAG TPA: ornithine cyclodeaminase family protein [Beijerinckiaceae bacterium]|jgi:ornithine cyclodeaminase/alanine dehydrogenase|nr:ornithine cyclodeaminase family protein [Beijerinckiaceae bacterium]
MTLLITQEIIERSFSIEMAIPVIEETFRMAGEGSTENPPRFVMPTEEGFLRFGAAALRDRKVMGFKLWANFGSGAAQSWNYLFSLETGELLAILHAYSLGRFRTSATTAVAAKYLSRSDASSVGIYGTGRLAEAQLRAIKAVRPIERVKAYSRTPKSREAFCKEVSGRLGIEIAPATTPEEVPQGADMIVTITNSHAPVLFGKWMARPALVLAIGANQWYEREIDDDIVRQAKLVVVDNKGQAKTEGGDLLWAAAHGHLNWDRVRELGEIVTGRVPVPDLNTDMILFESHGIAIEDVAVSAEMYRIAREKGLGEEINLNLGKARSEVLSPGVDVAVRR